MLGVLLKAMSRSIKIDEDSLLNEMDEGAIATRFAMYPRCSCPDRVYGVHPHSDGSVITALLPDKEVSEQILHSNRLITEKGKIELELQPNFITDI